jgi:threonine dehydrogenase-like Zn-dependent dehydrogenase
MLSRLVFWIALHPPVLRLRRQGDLDPSVLITHDLPLEAGVEAYDLFKKKAEAASGSLCGPTTFGRRRPVA